ncbi:MAG: TIGR03086 family metal-binding protein [Acidimicrobiia bacterium]
MALDLPTVHDRALAATRAIVAGVGDDQWSLPTPCAEWNVRELVNHIVAGNFWAAELGAGKTIPEVGDRLDGDVLGDDPLAAYDASAAAASAVFSAPGAMEAPCAVSYGPVPGEIYAGHRFIDVLIHGWDVAAATGQDTRIDPELVEVCWVVVEPQAEILVGSGVFAADVEAPPAAGPQAARHAVQGRRAP